MLRLFPICMLLLVGVAGCCNTEESETDVPCESLLDCPESAITCVLSVCVEGTCEWVNLTVVDHLPIDPESGLPLGKHCR
jgi:hypothetical protein